MANESPKQKFNQRQGWPIWFLIAVVIIVIFFVMDQNRKSENDAVSLNEIFKPEETGNTPVDEPVIERDVINETIPQDIPAPVAALPKAEPPQLPPEPQPPAAVQTEQPAVTTRPETTIPTTTKKSSGSFTIQVASFKDSSKAKQELDTLKKSGFAAYIVERDIKDKGLHYRVCVGEFNSKEEADVELGKLKKISSYQQSFVITK